MSNDQDDSGDANQSDRLAQAEVTEKAPHRGATGPRTLAGKRRSRKNSLRHGILAEVTILDGESAAAYRRLLSALRKDREPVGATEELLVEKLAVTVWRHRRLLLAEAAEIRKGREFLRWEHDLVQRENARLIVRTALPFGGGLLLGTQNPQVLNRAADLLAGLKGCIEKRGFDPRTDLPTLEKVYGHFETGDPLGGTLRSYTSLSQLMGLQGGEQKLQKDDISVACAHAFMKKLDEETCRLRKLAEEYAEIEIKRLEVVRETKLIPDSLSIDRFLRYEAALERTFYRTLSQLEREQRMRRGQPVLPNLEVDLNA